MSLLPDHDERMVSCPQCGEQHTIKMQGSFARGPHPVPEKCKKCGSKLLSSPEISIWARKYESRHGIS